jgi:glycerol-3-phosphate acyltransferase PlsY
MGVSNVWFLPLAFLIGSIPFSVIVGKLLYGVDVRKQGSGNPGATNTLRLLGAKAGFLVLVLDVAKGLVPVLLAPHVMKTLLLSDEELMAITGACAIMGHLFSPFLRFKGGKGVATSTGVIFALNWQIALAVTAVFVIVVYFSRYISLGSIISVIVFAVAESIYAQKPLIITFCVALALLVIYKHRANIQRLANGNENKFTLKKA